MSWSPEGKAQTQNDTAIRIFINWKYWCIKEEERYDFQTFLIYICIKFIIMDTSQLAPGSRIESSQISESEWSLP